MYQELTERILPFWLNLKDEQNGGLYGKVDFDLNIDKYGDKGGIVTARFLWTFSAAYRILKDEKYLAMADHVFQFLTDKLIDREHRGIYWLLDYQGKPIDTRKHIYAQSFAIYGLSEYYRITQKEEALELALELYDLIESIGFDQENQAYKEEFNREWIEVPNEMLSENGVVADITMNTHIHILEAYTNLYKAYPNEALKDRLITLLKVHYEKIYQHDTHFLGVFFDKQWSKIIDLKSFGHDIEAAWLMDDTIRTLGIENEAYKKMIRDISYNISEYAIQPDGSLINEEENGELDKTRVWWVQAEAIVGFYNAYQRTGDIKFLNRVQGLWNYIQTTIHDPRPNGEWYWSIEPDGSPTKRDLVEPWKASYHNARMALELIERMEKDDTQ
ncbi:AGE family epimerase/isomerase [Amphibacillus sp. MSJ-3]|nr:AGE family epimerase/isomerase [Amphibacillus sp. MSJ-3]MBU5593755.1 AGE family epimerase/isomerase [Amphibacillus sp. MSJ-3]